MSRKTYNVQIKDPVVYPHLYRGQFINSCVKCNTPTQALNQSSICYDCSKPYNASDHQTIV